MTDWKFITGCTSFRHPWVISGRCSSLSQRPASSFHRAPSWRRSGESESVCPSLAPRVSESRQPALSQAPMCSPLGQGHDLLFVNEIREVQFQDMGVTIHVSPQEILTGQMKRPLQLSQASPSQGAA